MKNPRILFYDLETSALEGMAWRPYDTNLLKVTRDWELLSVSWKWQGDSKIEVQSRLNKSERSLVKTVHSLMSKADGVVTHNGVSFDDRKSWAKFAEFDLDPVKPHVSYDTYRLSKGTFGFTSHSLDALCEKLGIGRKLKYKLGKDLWELAANGDKPALKKMERYNKHDVWLLEQLYRRIVKYSTRQLPNVALLSGYSGCRNPSCLSRNCQKRGYRVAGQSIRQQWQCMDCKHWFQTGLKEKIG